VLRAELAKAWSDTAVAVALVVEREPSGFGRSVRVGILMYFLCRLLQIGEKLENLTSFFLLVCAVVPVMTRRPGASLANPN
jgi:hypothetical protein